MVRNIPGENNSRGVDYKPSIYISWAMDQKIILLDINSLKEMRGACGDRVRACLYAQSLLGGELISSNDNHVYHLEYKQHGVTQKLYWVQSELCFYICQGYQGTSEKQKLRFDELQLLAACA